MTEALLQQLEALVDGKTPDEFIAEQQRAADARCNELRRSVTETCELLSGSAGVGTEAKLHAAIDALLTISLALIEDVRRLNTAHALPYSMRCETPPEYRCGRELNGWEVPARPVTTPLTAELRPVSDTASVAPSGSIAELEKFQQSVDAWLCELARSSPDEPEESCSPPSQHDAPSGGDAC